MSLQKSSRILALAFLGGVLATALLAEILAPIEATRQDLSSALIPPLGFGGTIEHPLGTDQAGRDMLARMIRGARISVLVGVGTVLLAGGIGITLGFMGAYSGGKLDLVVTGLGEIQQAFPGSMLALVLLLALGPGALTVILVIALAGWVVFARVIRGLTLSLKQQPFVAAVEVLGAPPRRVIGLHLLPNLLPSLLALATLEFAAAVLSESAYSFLGFGIQPPESSWGLIIAQGRNYLQTGWWIIALPGMAIASTVLAINVVAGWWEERSQAHIAAEISDAGPKVSDEQYAARAA
jgi:peptide/nickel transport system permease protein